MKKAVILEELGKCFLIAFLNNASPDKLINQIFLYLRCSYCEANLSSSNERRESVWDKGFFSLQPKLFHRFVLDSYSLLCDKEARLQSF